MSDTPDLMGILRPRPGVPAETPVTLTVRYECALRLAYVVGLPPTPRRSFDRTLQRAVGEAVADAEETALPSEGQLALLEVAA